MWLVTERSPSLGPGGSCECGRGGAHAEGQATWGEGVASCVGAAQRTQDYTATWGKELWLLLVHAGLLLAKRGDSTPASAWPGWAWDSKGAPA